MNFKKKELPTTHTHRLTHTHSLSYTHTQLRAPAPETLRHLYSCHTIINIIIKLMTILIIIILTIMLTTTETVSSEIYEGEEIIILLPL